MMKRYGALVRLETPGGFVEPGDTVRLAQETAEVLLAAGLVACVDDDGERKDAKAQGRKGPSTPDAGIEDAG